MNPIDLRFEKFWRKEIEKHPDRYTCPTPTDRVHLEKCLPLDPELKILTVGVCVGASMFALMAIFSRAPITFPLMTTLIFVLYYLGLRLIYFNSPTMHKVLLERLDQNGK